MPQQPHPKHRSHASSPGNARSNGQSHEEDSRRHTNRRRKSIEGTIRQAHERSRNRIIRIRRRPAVQGSRPGLCNRQHRQAARAQDQGSRYESRSDTDYNGLSRSKSQASTGHDQASGEPLAGLSTVAIVPVKTLADAKRRLSRHLTIQERRLVVLAMLEDVLNAIKASNAFQETIVVSPDKTVIAAAAKHGSKSLLQTGPGLNTGIQQATSLAIKTGAAITANILADIPLIQPQDFDEILRIGSGSPRVILSPSFDGGTNIMLRSPANIIDHSYGRWSFTRHLRNAQKKQIPVYAVSNARSSFDVDTIDDLRNILRLDPRGGTRTGAQVGEFQSLLAMSCNS